MLYPMEIYEGLLSYTLKTGKGLRNFTNTHTHTPVNSQILVLVMF